MEKSVSSSQETSRNTSSFAPLRNAKGLAEVMDFLAQENTAAIIEALRSEKWSEQLFPLYIGHKNHVVRYEIACAPNASMDYLKRLINDPEMIVRQAATQNMLKRTQKVAPPVMMDREVSDKPSIEVLSEKTTEDSSSTNKDKKNKNKKGKKR